ncbi:MAG: permease prefix domain 1-containing protein [Acidobacteriota bacterium]|nr:permease prefix domain 1-containing protein [Acidobacteriota bacterium]
MNIFHWKHRKDEELNAEIQTHLNEAIRERMERGESAEEARRNAQREFGNVGLVKEARQEMWGKASLMSVAMLIFVITCSSSRPLIRPLPGRGLR